MGAIGRRASDTIAARGAQLADRRVLLALIVLVAVGCRLAGAGDRLSLDEGYSWLVANAAGWHGFLDSLARYENTPPAAAAIYSQYYAVLFLLPLVAALAFELRACWREVAALGLAPFLAIVPLIPLAAGLIGAAIDALEWRAAVPVAVAALAGLAIAVLVQRTGRELEPDYARVHALAREAHPRVVLTNSAVVSYSRQDGGGGPDRGPGCAPLTPLPARRALLAERANTLAEVLGAEARLPQLYELLLELRRQRVWHLPQRADDAFVARER
jgi:hypothetical protein